MFDSVEGRVTIGAAAIVTVLQFVLLATAAGRLVEWRGVEARREQEGDEDARAPFGQALGQRGAEELGAGLRG